MPPFLRTLSDTAKRLLRDPRSWALLIFLAGLPTLDLPFHDDHQWRQAITATIARNFYEVRFHLLYPLYDICGRVTPDHFATEFPLLPGLTAGGYFLFGDHFWVGRGIVWATSCLGLWYFARLVDRLAGAPAGLLAMLCLAGSIVLTFSRKMMPDTFSLFLVIIGTYQWWTYLDAGRRRDLLWGTLWVGLGVLSKIPAVVVLCFLGAPFLDLRHPWSRKFRIVVAMALVAALTVAWYFYWMPRLQETTACTALIYPSSLSEGWRILWEERGWQTFYRFERTAFYSIFPFYLSLVGLSWALLRGKWRLLAAALVYTLLFFLFIMKTGKVFATHTYYVIPFVPLMAACVGYLFSRPRLGWVFALLLVLGLGVPAFRGTGEDVRLFPELPELELEALLDGAGVGRDAKIMINGGTQNPRYMYYAHRRGWSIDGKIFQRYDWMPDFQRMGLRYLVVIRKRYPAPLNYPLLVESADFRIYDLTEWARPQVPGDER